MNVNGSTRGTRYSIDACVVNKRSYNVLMNFSFFLIQVPPTVDLSGLHHPVTEGDNVTLTCNITDGLPKPDEIRWLKDKTSLEERKPMLVLRDIKKEQEGTYTCKARNGAGSANDSIKVIVDSKTLRFC